MTMRRATKFAVVTILAVMTGLPQAAEAGPRRLNIFNKRPAITRFKIPHGNPVIVRPERSGNSINSFASPHGPQKADEPVKIPDWIRNNAGWWADGPISAAPLGQIAPDE